MEKETCTKFCGVFWSVLTKLWSYKVLNVAWVTSYPRMYKIFHPWFSLRIFVNFMEPFMEPFTLFYGHFDHFSWTYEVAKFWMIKSCLDGSDVIHVNEHMWYATCGLHVNFWLMPIFLWWERSPLRIMAWWQSDLASGSIATEFPVPKRNMVKDIT